MGAVRCHQGSDGVLVASGGTVTSGFGRREAEGGGQ